MSAGRIEQVGTPQQVYREPASRFVAEFVGENNVFDGTVRDGHVSVNGATFQLNASDGPTTFCVRPEAMRLGGGTNTLTGRVKYAEFLGGAVRVGLSWQGQELVVRTDSVPEATKLTVGFDPTDAVVLTPTG
jgi:thiamine transport system ATP-binding protein